MKKIINGLKYDTDTAKECGSYSSGGWGDFHHFEETLYRKRTGEFFLYGEGGPASRYAEAVGLHEWTGGERIMPMSYAEAQEWAENHLDADDYEEIFGEVSEDDSRKTVALSIAVSTLERAKRKASQSGVSLSAYVESLILAD